MDDFFIAIAAVIVGTLIAVIIIFTVEEFSDYDYIERELVQAIVVDKGTHMRHTGKPHHTVYDTIFKYEDIETKIEGSSLYNNLEINDEITMNKCIYYKDGEITKIELELIK